MKTINVPSTVRTPQAMLVAATLVLVTLVVSVLPLAATADAQVGEQENVYQLYDTNGMGAWNLDVGMRVLNSSPSKFIAQTFDLDTGGGGYFGLQERDNDRIAIFSMWRDGLSGSADVRTTGVGDCDSHGENGAGVRCRLSYDWETGKTYKLRLWRLSGNSTYDRWGAWVISGNVHTKIGEIEVRNPLTRKGVLNNTNTFLEDFASQADCQAPVLARVRLWQPTLNNGRTSLDFAGLSKSPCAAGRVAQNKSGTSSWLSLGTGRVTLVGKGGNCLTLPGNDRTNGTNLKMNTCWGGAAQRWRQAPNGQIVLAGTNKCLDVEGPSTANWTPVQIWDCQNVPQHQWTVNSNGSIVGFGGKCLDIRGGSTSPGAVVQIYSCHTDPVQRQAQTWQRRPA